MWRAWYDIVGGVIELWVVALMAEILNSSANEPQQTRQGQVKQLLLYETACVVMVSDWRLYSSNNQESAS